MNAENESPQSLPDYYAVLGVPADADGQAIARAYEKLSRNFQPVLDEPPVAPEAMRRLDEAFDVLDVPAKRAEYDRALAAAGRTPAPPRQRLLTRPQARVGIAAGVLVAVIASIVGGFLLFSGGDGGDATPVSYPLQILAPLQGATVTSPVKVEVASTHLIAAPELNLPGAAHYHIFVDKIPFTAAGQTIPSDEGGVYHFVDNQIHLDLEPGFHNITLVLGDNSHIRMHGPDAPAVAVDIMVAEPSPSSTEATPGPVGPSPSP